MFNEPEKVGRRLLNALKARQRVMSALRETDEFDRETFRTLRDS
jgi:hypothetical protein